MGTIKDAVRERLEDARDAANTKWKANEETWQHELLHEIDVVLSIVIPELPEPYWGLVNDLLKKIDALKPNAETRPSDSGECPPPAVLADPLSQTPAKC